ncbi:MULTISPECIES: hypothetical protein [Nostoc]|uniref:hypothetical protein n=1 Tax=Nostoc TaxID=1177 RepID=UPI0036F27105
MLPFSVRLPDNQPGSDLPFECVNILGQQSVAFTNTASTEEADTELSCDRGESSIQGYLVTHLPYIYVGRCVTILLTENNKRE